MAGPFCDDFADAAWAEGTALTYAALKAAGHDEFMAGAIRRQTVEKADWFAAFAMDLPGKMCPVDGLINTPRGAHAIRFKGEPDVQIVLRGLLITFAMDECLPAVSLGRLKRQIEAAAVRSRRRQTSPSGHRRRLMSDINAKLEDAAERVGSLEAANTMREAQNVIGLLRAEIERLTRQIEDAQGSCFLLLKAIEEGDPMRELQIRVRDLERILNPKPVSDKRTEKEGE